ncbi:unnamed protein product [marine sediment metagenome]|uniref:Uncharacterized protein n=1 Tax=marine sediment metagenome TaxID=412755 RepID=X1SLX7_9ZZZZ
MKVFCPSIQGLCDEGYPGDHQCIMWDEEEQLCLVREHMRYIVTEFKARAEMQARIRAKSAQLSGTSLKQ